MFRARRALPFSATMPGMRIRWQFLTVPVLFATVSPLVAGELPKDAIADRIIVLKARRELQLLHEGKVLKTYRVALEGNPIGPKQRQGDGRTPEGTYFISTRNPKSQFHLSPRISYPNQEQRGRAKKMGVDPGGDIYIHGLPKGWEWVGAGHRMKDWTNGCIAVTNDEIEEMWRVVPNGTRVEIRP
ncbi:MAG TPA: L,D-transpeptidase family protein [Clostridia bacterium]|nr:L,D-transpeptidase family protein [Clostridia bacterium]